MSLSSKIIRDALLKDNSSFNNAVCSPVSLLFLLSVLSEYEEGEIKNEIKSILDSFGFNRESLIKSIKDINKATLKIHTSLWYDENFTLKEKELLLLEKIGCDFKKALTAKEINGWVGEKTQGLINNIELGIPNNVLSSVLINVIYLKCFWQNAFNTPLCPLNFTLLNGRTKEIGYLSKSDKEEIFYLNEEEFDAIALPYKGEKLQFEIYLPKKKIGFEKFINSLDKIDFQKIIEKFIPTTDYSLSFPKFEISCEMNIEKILMKNNLHQILESRNSPYFKEEILETYTLFQTAKIKVNEDGTEAAAVTYLPGVTGTGEPIEPKVKFIANRPFFFLIRELGSNSLLFTGVLTEPSKFSKTIEKEMVKNSWLRKIFDLFRIFPR